VVVATGNAAVGVTDAAGVGVWGMGVRVGMAASSFGLQAHKDIMISPVRTIYTVVFKRVLFINPTLVFGLSYHDTNIAANHTQ
jgi:hypothetical protein